MSDAPDLDAILDALKSPAGGDSGGGNQMMQFMMIQMERDRADRAAQRQTTLTLITSLAPLLLPVLLGKKEADPVMMTLLSGLLNKNNDGEQLKSFMQMMSAASHMSMEQMKTSMLGIMELKDQQTKKMLEDRDDGDGESASGPAGIMREIRLGLASLAPLVTASAPEPQPVQNLPHNPGQPGQQPPQQRKAAPPVVVLLHQLAAIQSGQTKQTPATWAALATVALQDPLLIQAVDDCADDDLTPLMGYCAPHVQRDPKLLAWISAPGVGQWVDDQVRKRLMPMIDAARPDDEDEGTAGAPEPEGNEPEELQPPDDAAEGTG